jgi:hypothetical protein
LSDPILSTDEIQKALLMYLQSKPNITVVVSAGEIREAEYQGTEFTYPNIRLRITENIPTYKSCYQDFELRVTSFSEEASSLEVQQITGIITRELHGKGFSSNNLAFTMSLLRTLPPVRSERQTWREEIHLRGTVSG